MITLAIARAKSVARSADALLKMEIAADAALTEAQHWRSMSATLSATLLATSHNTTHNLQSSRAGGNSAAEKVSDDTRPNSTNEQHQSDSMRSERAEQRERASAAAIATLQSELRERNDTLEEHDATWLVEQSARRKAAAADAEKQAKLLRAYQTLHEEKRSAEALAAQHKAHLLASEEQVAVLSADVSKSDEIARLQQERVAAEHAAEMAELRSAEAASASVRYLFFLQSLSSSL